MRKSCGNCEHYDMCSLAGEGGISYCELWIGWRDSKEELPEKDYTGVLVVLSGNVKDVACWDKEHGFRPWYAGFYEEVPPAWEREVVAWRYLP